MTDRAELVGASGDLAAGTPRDADRGTDAAPGDGAADRTDRRDAAGADPTESADRDQEPNFSEQLAEQLGGMRGLTESGIPVGVFVVVNIIWSLYPALIASVAVAFGIVLFRLFRGEPIRHAINGVVGVALGAAIAWKTGRAKDYFALGIAMSFLYGALMIVSVAIRHPVVGYVWAVIAAKGSHVWRNRPRLLRTFQWLTLLWAGLFLLKGGVQWTLYLLDEVTWLGIARIGMGYPPYLVMLGVTVWAVRRATHDDPILTKTDSDPAPVSSASTDNTGEG